MKSGAKALAPNLQGTFPVDNAVSTLGLGWIGAYLVLSGSPVAAVALSLFAARALTELQAFTMLSGGRMGAHVPVSTYGETSSSEADEGPDSSNDAPYSGLHASTHIDPCTPSRCLAGCARLRRLHRGHQSRSDTGPGRR